MKTHILVVAGTRPGFIKLAPVIEALRSGERWDVSVVSTAQQADLVPATLRALDIRVDLELDVMRPNQNLNALLARIVESLDTTLEDTDPDLVIVQGDTTTALAGALAASMRGVAVAHVEAGLRTGDPQNPFPEEINRRLVTQLASLHLAPTAGNRDNLLAEGVPANTIAVTGNPIVNALAQVDGAPSDRAATLLEPVNDKRVILLTTHRRESFGAPMESNLRVLGEFVSRHEDVALVAPVHPNPAVVGAFETTLKGADRVHLCEPLDYPNFVALLRRAWLVISDSGGIQEEVASLGKPLLVLRDVTERPEALACGIARLVGKRGSRLRETLDALASDGGWLEAAAPMQNPFGDASTSERIAEAITDYLGRQ